MTHLGNQFETLIREAVEEFCGEYATIMDQIKSILDDHNETIMDQTGSILENHDFSDAIKDVIKDEVDVEGAVTKAIEDFDFSDAVHDSVRDYDWWGEIENKVKDEIENCVEGASDELQGEIDRRFDSPEFKELVKAVVVSIIKDAVWDCWDTVVWPFRKVWSAIRKRV